MLRPADSIETAECWEIALESKKAPSVLALTRQNLPTLRSDYKTNLSALGGYVLSNSLGIRQATLIASGSEVALAIKAQDTLRSEGIDVAVVSMPCLDLFEHQDSHQHNTILGDAPRIVIEAGIEMCWSKYLRDKDTFIGMTGFGASAPASVLFEKIRHNPRSHY